MRYAGWGLLLLVAILTGTIWWLMKTSPVLELALPPMPSPTLGSIHIQHVLIRGVSGGKVVWQVDAENFDMSRANHMLVTGMKQIVVLNNGKEELTIHADTLDRDIISGDMTLSGHVSITGKDIMLRAPSATWSAWQECLRIPRNLEGKLGDYTLAAPGETVFDVKASELRCVQGLALQTKGNSVRAGSARVNVAKQSYALDRPVRAELNVADVQDWVSGQPLPAIPAIPPGVKERYRAYCAKFEQKPPSVTPMHRRPTQGVSR